MGTGSPVEDIFDPQTYKALEERKSELQAGRFLRLGDTVFDAPYPEELQIDALDPTMAIVSYYRPSLLVQHDTIQYPPRGHETDEVVVEALRNLNALSQCIPSVGRLDLENNDELPTVGTGWLIDTELGTDVVVTNRHVAQEFTAGTGSRLRFMRGIPNHNKIQDPRIDFRAEHVGLPSRPFSITEPIWISEDPAIDMALLRVQTEADDDSIGAPIPLARSINVDDRMLGVIGYPGFAHGYDLAAFHRMFGGVLGAKRFSPGMCIDIRGHTLLHDASTLPGSSGSVVIDVETGQAVGLHFSGKPFVHNSALASTTIGRVLRNQPWRSNVAVVPRWDRTEQSRDKILPERTPLRSTSQAACVPHARTTREFLRSALPI